ncbi:hypothetical protein TPA0907_13610 [Micromonospora humidisoli]|uniref:hypothetical protein n=1 Tax=Micromonospora sp. AKA109 TaxID=2733865 RepID=UPI0022CA8380|nr:hypothetical protein [Micromonospora sp. AKA109]GHJ06994.1 hypothetical protein TPA0907_13610 [Micromonospora sp. AKA109]
MNDDREEIARRVEAQARFRPPEALLDVWTGVRPMTAAEAAVDVSLYSPDEIAERNLTYEVAEYAPDMMLIGDDGGGRGLFVAGGDPDPEVLLIGLGAVGSDSGARIGRLSSLLENDFHALGLADAEEESPVPIDPIDILITHRPGVKAMVEIRRLLHLSLPVGALVGVDARFPMVVLTNVRYARYAEAIDQLNLSHRCLAVRPHIPA